MSKFRMILMPDNISFEVSPGEIMLDAAIAQGVPVPYTCRSGTCRSCLLQVSAGEICPVEPDQCLISKEELDSNRRLLCMATAKSDAVLERVRRRKERMNMIDWRNK